MKSESDYRVYLNRNRVGSPCVSWVGGGCGFLVFALVVEETKKMSETYRIGDIVSRDGTDEHKIISIDHDWGIMTIECIKEPETKWIKKGERESNLIRKYTLIRKVEEEGVC